VLTALNCFRRWVNKSLQSAHEVRWALYIVLTKKIYELRANRREAFVASAVDAMLFALIPGLGPYAIAVIMPTWRWLLGVTLVIGGVLAAVWVQHWIASAAPDYSEGPGGGIGIGFFLIITVGFVAGVGIRALTLVLRSKGVHFRYLLGISVAGLPIFLALWSALKI
jgi:hypothetical protein